MFDMGKENVHLCDTRAVLVDVDIAGEVWLSMFMLSKIKFMIIKFNSLPYYALAVAFIGEMSQPINHDLLRS